MPYTLTAPGTGATPSRPCPFNPDEPALEESPGYYEDLCQEELERHLASPCTVLLYRLYETEHPEHGPIEVRDLQVAQALTFSTVEEALAFVDAATEAQDAYAGYLDGLAAYDFEIVPVGLGPVTPTVTCAGAS